SPAGTAFTRPDNPHHRVVRHSLCRLHRSRLRRTDRAGLVGRVIAFRRGRAGPDRVLPPLHDDPNSTISRTPGVAAGSHNPLRAADLGCPGLRPPARGSKSWQITMTPTR